jgi:hypothetical protein
MNATVIMISQGAMALGGVIWGSAGANYTLLGAAVLFLTSLSGPSAFDKLCRRTRREGFTRFIYCCQACRRDAKNIIPAHSRDRPV